MERALAAWMEQHGQTAHETLGHLLRAPLATAMTLGTIAIALALPAILYLLLINLERFAGDWERSAAVSLFLAPTVDEGAAAGIAAELQARPDVARVELIARERGLAEFREYSGLGGALDQLGENPLPVVLALYPSPVALEQASLDRLIAWLETRPEVDFVRLDSQWLQRLQGILGLLGNTALLLGVTLGLAVLLVVGNTIRLEIENRRGEIRIMDLVGATPAFVRRPFLYSGAWHGLFGGLLAWLLVALGVGLLQRPVGNLAALYHTQFAVAGLDARATLILLAGSMTLGMLGSWLAVARHLSGVEPD